MLYHNRQPNTDVIVVHAGSYDDVHRLSSDRRNQDEEQCFLAVDCFVPMLQGVLELHFTSGI